MSKVRYVPLSEVATFKGGSTPHRQNQKYFGGEIPWVKTTDLNNSLIVHTEETLTELGLKESSCKMIDPGAVLVAMYGGFNQIGRTGVLTQKSAINQALTAVIPDPKRLNPIFLNEWLNYRVKYWKRFAVSSRKDPNITKSDVEDFPVPVLDIDYQNKAVNVLQTWTNAIETAEQMIAAKQRYFDGLIQKMFQPNQDTDLWQPTNLSKILVSKEKSKPVLNHNMQLAAIGVYGLRLRSEIYSKELSKDTLNYIIFSNREICFGLGSNELVFAVNSSSDDYLVSSAYNIFKIDGTIDPSFLEYYLRYLNKFLSTKYLIISARQGKSVDFQGLFSEIIRLPELTQQIKIAEVLNTAKCEIDVLKKLAESYRLQKQGLMQKLLSGEWRVAV